MRIIRGLLVAVSAGALTMGMVGTAQASDTQQLTDSCQGVFGACTQTLNFAPELLGDISLLDSASLLGTDRLIGPNGLVNTTALTGATGQTASTASTASTATTGKTGTTG
ncbi:hypothetical protein [Streptomyces sp. NPDC015130]|uniref:hypothetical protein n=1 Tax=Streptomyces sp. NPDC015130 TaxID=3364940 RepID=UPI0036F9BBCF